MQSVRVKFILLSKILNAFVFREEFIGDNIDIDPISIIKFPQTLELIYLLRELFVRFLVSDLVMFGRKRIAVKVFA